MTNENSSNNKSLIASVLIAVIGAVSAIGVAWINKSSSPPSPTDNIKSTPSNTDTNKSSDTNSSTDINSFVSCSNLIKSGAILSWSTQKNGNIVSIGTIRIDELQDDGLGSGIQIHSSHGQEEDIDIEISKSTFVLRVPRWTETWKGTCSQDGIAGFIQRTMDNEYFTFLIK